MKPLRVANAAAKLVTPGTPLSPVKIATGLMLPAPKKRSQKPAQQSGKKPEIEHEHS
jgi:hypothetical protein